MQFLTLTAKPNLGLIVDVALCMLCGEIRALLERQLVDWIGECIFI